MLPQWSHAVETQRWHISHVSKKMIESLPAAYTLVCAVGWPSRPFRNELAAAGPLPAGCGSGPRTIEQIRSTR